MKTSVKHVGLAVEP